MLVYRRHFTYIEVAHTVIHQWMVLQLCHNPLDRSIGANCEHFYRVLVSDPDRPSLMMLVHCISLPLRTIFKIQYTEYCLTAKSVTVRSRSTRQNFLLLPGDLAVYGWQHLESIFTTAIATRAFGMAMRSHPTIGGTGG